MSSPFSVFLIIPKQNENSCLYNYSSIQSLIENPLLSKYTSLDKLTSHLTFDHQPLYELEISSTTLNEFKKIFECIAPAIKLIPVSKVRRIIIQKIPQFVPMIDIFTILNQQVGSLRQLIAIPNLYIQGIHQGKFVAEFESYEKCVEALKSINEHKQLNIFGNKAEASIAEPTENTVEKIIIKDIRILSFLNIGTNIEIQHFKEYIEKYIQNFYFDSQHENNESPLNINSIRQYASSLVITFDNYPLCFEQYFDIEKHKNRYFDYMGHNIPIVPLMKPCINFGKYKDKITKISCFDLTQKNKDFLFNKFFDKNQNDEKSLKKKAEIALNKIIDNEKKEKEVLKLKKREREK